MSKTKVVVNKEGMGLAVSESDRFIASPKFFNDAPCRLVAGKGLIDANSKEQKSGFVCESSYTLMFNCKCQCLTCDTNQLAFQGIRQVW